jgi:hypothetical protein
VPRTGRAGGVGSHRGRAGGVGDTGAGPLCSGRGAGGVGDTGAGPLCSGRGAGPLFQGAVGPVKVWPHRLTAVVSRLTQVASSTVRPLVPYSMSNPPGVRA